MEADRKMISVESLTKRFADSEAVNGVSFTVEKGEVLGFLGPNGAGKSTTMRMLTCFVPPTSGTAKVGGYDILESPVEVRRQIGYLPENVPLYGEMRVHEYLRFRARLKGVARSRVAARLDYVTARCGLGEVRGRVIDRLSKGYRQRVGLAETLLHEPPILILDEPTVGLDPQQIRQVRELIRDLGREHTIILSSHILPEVEQVCRRVAIIHRGRIVAQDSLSALGSSVGGAQTLDVEIRGPREAVLEGLTRIPGARIVVEAPADGSRGAPPAVLATLETVSGQDLREEVFRLSVERGWVLLSLSQRRLTLEEVFINLTMTEEETPAAMAPQEVA
jgi:ABC-2 type transport system ATP-binding protein